MAAQPLHRLFVNAVAGGGTLDVPDDDTGFLEPPKMLGDGRLGQWQGIDQRASLANASSSQLLDDKHAGWVAEGAEHGDKALVVGFEVEIFH